MKMKTRKNSGNMGGKVKRRAGKKKKGGGRKWGRKRGKMK